MRIIRSVAATLLMLAASTSSHAGSLPASAKTIGVLPLLPANGHLFQVALLRFNNACKPFDLKGANLEAAAYNAAAAALGPRYKTVRLTAPASAEIHTRNTEVMGAFKSFPTIAAQIRQMAHPPQSVDAFLLVWGRAKDSDCLDLPRAYGFGLTKLGANPAAVHAYAEVILIDAHTDEELGTANMKGATAPLPGFDWKNQDKPAEVSPEQAQQIRTAMQKMFAAAVAADVRTLVPAQ
jgi:hypothetical protein